MDMRIWKVRTRSGSALVLALLAAGCRPASGAEEHQVVPQIVMTDVQFRLDRAGDLRATGDARRAVLRRDTTDVSAQDFTVLLPSQGPEGPARVSAPAGAGVISEHRFSAWGGVRAFRGQDVAVTERARYEPAGPDGAAGVVRGDDPVEVTGAGYRLSGTGFVLDPATGDLTVLGHPRLLTGGAPGR